MHCAINYGTNVSLWINNDCTEYELREGNFDLDASERIITKAITLKHINLDMCHNEYECGFYSNNYFVYIKTGLRYSSRLASLRLVFYIKLGNSTDYINIEYVAPTELLIFHYFNSDMKFYSNKIVLFLLERALVEAFESFKCDLPDSWKYDLVFYMH